MKMQQGVLLVLLSLFIVAAFAQSGGENYAYLTLWSDKHCTDLAAVAGLTQEVNTFVGAAGNDCAKSVECVVNPTGAKCAEVKSASTYDININYVFGGLHVIVNGNNTYPNLDSCIQSEQYGGCFYKYYTQRDFSIINELGVASSAHFVLPSIALLALAMFAL